MKQHYPKHNTHLKKTLLLLSLCGLFQTGQAQTLHELDWVNITGNTNNDLGRFVKTDAKGNVYSSGTFSGTVDFYPGPGTANLTAISGGKNTYLCKTDSSGNFLWARLIDAGGKMAFDASNNVYVTCNFSSPTTEVDMGSTASKLSLMGTADAYLAKFDPSGNFVWAKQFGGDMQTVLNSLSIDISGNIFLTGHFTGTTDFDPGPASSSLSAGGSGSHIFITKLDASGNYQWTRVFEGSDASFSSGTFICNDLSGNIITTGYLHDTVDFDPGTGIKRLVSTSSVSDIFISKLDGSGNFVWAKQIGGTEPDWAYSVTTDKSGNVYATGTVDGKADFNPDGGGHYIFTEGAAGSPDVYIAKFNSGGLFQWAYLYGGAINDAAGGVICDDEENVYLAGSFQGIVDFDQKSGLDVEYRSTDNTHDGFILKLDKSGDYQWVKQLVSENPTSSNYITAIDIDPKGSLLCTGYFLGLVDFSPSDIETMDLSSAGQNDIFCMRFKTREATRVDPAGPNTAFFKVYPNPTQDYIRLDFGQELKDASIRILDLAGRQVLQSPCSGNSYQLDISGIAAGAYYLELESETLHATQLIHRL